MFKYLVIWLFFVPVFIQAQIETFWVDTSAHQLENASMFFTNRPVKINAKSGQIEFKNKATRQTDNLFFCLYDHDHDSILIRYRARNPHEQYPRKEVNNNIMYQLYEDYRLNRGITHFSFVVPGFSHKFREQIGTFMHRLKTVHSDSVKEKMAVILYAWGDEWRPYRYYRAKKSAKHGANDFAIFQHMLEDFLSDSAYFSTRPKDMKFYLSCTSMGNQLFKEYLLERKRQDIPLQKVYESILFIGSDASWDSFEPGNGFDQICMMTDSVRVIWHDKDIPLKVSKVANMKKRMGLHGPKESEHLPGCVTSHDVGDLLEPGDKKGLWHDYTLTNPTFQKMLNDAVNEQEE